MLDLSTLKKGSVVRFTGTIVHCHEKNTIVIPGETGYDVQWVGGQKSDSSYMTTHEMRKAELVSQPKWHFTKEQSQAIRARFGELLTFDDDDFISWVYENSEE